MARALIVGCGCRGRELGKLLLSQGWEVRGTSRDEKGLKAIGVAGIEPALADPDRPGTVLDLIDGVAVLIWLLGSLDGRPKGHSAIHGTSLERVLERLVETPVRGFVYEAAGNVESDLLTRGQQVVEAAADTWQIPVACVFVDPGDDETWADPLEVWLESMSNSVLDMTGRAE